MRVGLWLARRYRSLTGRRAPTPAPTPASEAQRASAAGDAARDRQDFVEAVRQYSVAVALVPENTPIRVQLGHILKDANRLVEAEAAYRAAIESDPDNAETYLHLGHVLKVQGRTGDAIEVYAESLHRDPSSLLARNELIAIGGRHRLPDSQYGRSAVTEGLSRISRVLDQNLEAIRDWVSVSTFPLEAYDRFRVAFPIQPPPTNGPHLRAATILIEAVSARPVAVRLTLTALLDQRDTNWTAIVRAPPEILNHSVASLALVDPRIRFSDSPITDIAETLPENAPVLLLDAGTRLDREALGWLRFAAERTKAQAVYADHDHHSHDWRLGTIHLDPALQTSADSWDLATTPKPPAALLVSGDLRSAVLDGLLETSGPEQRRRVLLTLLRHGERIAHLPRLLSSVRLDETTFPPPSPSLAAPAEQVAASQRQDDRILVVIPTRDEPDLLEACLNSLKAKAARKDLLDIIVVDNRSILEQTRALLDARTASNEIAVLSLDEPFNWARLNNLAVEGQPHEILVFANNDVEMLSPGWDDRLRLNLSHPRVGIIGARLLYPDRTLQHAGVMMGAASNRPVHEGLGFSEKVAGPLDRWRRARQAAAVTGAFMAVDRALFDQLGGFNARLAIGYNDIELCLRARAADRAVLYDPAVEAIHYESKTRGLNNDGSKTAWDNDELGDLYADWGDWLFVDPGKNPHWVSAHWRVFDGFRDLSLSQVLHSLDLSAHFNPWSITSSRPPLADADLTSS